MARIMLTRLRPASGGFGEWDWVESDVVDGAEAIADYEALCRENNAEPLRTEELDGRIHNQRGVVYKFDQSYEAGGERIEDWHYEMVWEEEEVAATKTK